MATEEVSMRPVAVFSVWFMDAAGKKTAGGIDGATTGAYLDDPNWRENLLERVRSLVMGIPEPLVARHVEAETVGRRLEDDELGVAWSWAKAVGLSPADVRIDTYSNQRGMRLVHIPTNAYIFEDGSASYHKNLEAGLARLAVLVEAKEKRTAQALATETDQVDVHRALEPREVLDLAHHKVIARRKHRHEG